MHQLRGMSHRSLRIGALALLAALAIWPRTKSGGSAAELARKSESPRVATTHHVGVHAESPAPASVSAPRATKPVLATNERSQPTN
jgi:hypothetical protein